MGMESRDFLHFRKKLHKTQEEMSKLLGVSVKAVRSYEQGWRSVPSHVARQMLFLISKKEENLDPLQPCWIIKNCKQANRETCPAWEFQAGTLCWFMYGTACNNGDQKTWNEKIKFCQNCSAFPPSLRTEYLKKPQDKNDSSSDEDCLNQR
jgi:DNA-binding XRE family transcriptional regulator